MAEIEIKPCPFCGGEAKLTTCMDESWVSCKSCLASAPLVASKEGALKAWNDRTTEE
jgi:Lar family restriction alleviation protein